MKKFVLSTQSFDTIEDAEKKATGYLRAGQLKQETKIYEVSKTYCLELKVTKKKK
jgi:hypothetical protein